MPYQGHLPDGSSIQRHSAGTHYPFIVGKQEGQRRPWFVMEPSGKIIDRQVECRVAFENAEYLARARRERERQAAAAAAAAQPPQPATARVYVASLDREVELPLNTRSLTTARYPDGWGVV